MCVCVCLCERECVCLCVSVSVCVRERERERERAGLTTGKQWRVKGKDRYRERTTQAVRFLFCLAWRGKTGERGRKDGWRDCTCRDGR